MKAASGKGPGGVTVLMKVLHEAQERLPAHARSAFHTIGSQLRALASEVDRLEAADPAASLHSYAGAEAVHAITSAPT